MDKALLIQLLGSAVAVSLLVAIAAWARIPRATPPLDADGARALLAVEFPDERIDALWIAADGAGLVARSAARGLVAWHKGDGYVARDLPWTVVLAATAQDGGVRLRTGDGVARLALENGATWPPPLLVSRELAA